MTVLELNDVVTWVLEPGAFSGPNHPLERAAVRAGHRVVSWDDEWWLNGGWPRLSTCPVVFHGSLGNADRIRGALDWRPGVYCDTEAFRCSAWYTRARPWLLHTDWRVMPARELVANPTSSLESLGEADRVFVRPDSALKPFAGRVVDTAKLTLAALDFGFYYDDEDLPVVVAPVRRIGREWRYVVVDRTVVAGSEYVAAGRQARPSHVGGAAWELAAESASRLEPPETVYVMDVCEVDGELRLLELNPFSGADLYACDADEVVAAVSRAATSAWLRVEEAT